MKKTKAKARRVSTLKRANLFKAAGSFWVAQTPALKRWASNPAGKPRERGCIRVKSMNGQFKYDVVFSFRQDDEQLALEVADRFGSDR